MRLLKFRAWNTTNKEMSKPFNLFKDVGTDYDGALLLVNEKKNFYLDGNSLILMQFTGIKDRNEKEIYEGDILKLSDLVTEEIIFREGQFLPKYCLPHESADSMRDGEVVGNIYQNPELKK